MPAFEHTCQYTHLNAEVQIFIPACEGDPLCNVWSAPGNFSERESYQIIKVTRNAAAAFTK